MGVAGPFELKLPDQHRLHAVAAIRVVAAWLTPYLGLNFRIRTPWRAVHEHTPGALLRFSVLTAPHPFIPDPQVDLSTRSCWLVNEWYNAAGSALLTCGRRCGKTLITN
jgi:hypothetical protein